MAIGARVLPVQATPTLAQTTLYGPSNAQVQAAVSASHWPQQVSNWCGIATIAAIAQFRGHAVSQQDVVNYLNSDAGVSEWGTPSTVPNEGPGFRGDIARDLGSDPRSLAAGLAATGQGAYHEVVALQGSYDATLHLVADLLRSNEPISVIVYHGFHSVLVSGIVATGNPLTNPSSITGLEVWDPGVGVPNGNIQPDQEDFVPLGTWLSSEYYWGSPYAPNYFGNLALDPDPAVGPYTDDVAHGQDGHLWIGHYVYIRSDAASDPFTAVSPDWAVSQTGALIMGFHGEVPTSYTGPATSIPIVTTLGERSFDGPAFWSEAAYQPVAAAFKPASVLAWTGTDPDHHVNVSVSADGVNFTNKITLGETSIARPSVIVVPNANNTANVVVISWVGTDPNHSLNVLYDVYGVRQKVTFGETSPYPTSLAYFNGQIWMAWAGTDGNHTPNSRALGPTGLTLGAKQTLWGNSSNATPNLVADPQNNRLLMTWQIASSGRLNLLQSPDGLTWSGVLAGPSPQTSSFSPALMAINPAPTATDFPQYYWSWTGTDGNQSLNVQRATALTSWSPVTTYGFSSLNAPQLGFVGGDHQIVMIWTDSGGAHNINIAVIPV